MVAPDASTTQVPLICIIILCFCTYNQMLASVTLKCTPINGTRGHNVTMNPPPFNHHTTYVYWYRGSGKPRKELCRYDPGKRHNNAKIKFMCLNNYSLLLINLTAIYNGDYTVQLDLGLWSRSEKCYKLTVRNANTKVLTTTRKTTSTSKPLTTTGTTTRGVYRTTHITTHSSTELSSTCALEIISLKNHTSQPQTYNHSAIHVMWLLIPILIVILCLCSMRSRKKHRKRNTVLTTTL
ncbi:membrane protein RL11M [Cercopithecine betaherpesvirus 5]|uniref:Membrane protein RL11M n=1 Tax=Simian cytomegalovirus (strain Colburn) TaxID=50292 RepID=G8XTR3_SCMVC|nr:membrane protein RL11M [Cercopithecine betaherpesvirus 5]